MTDAPIDWARVREQTHVFQNIRPRHPDANAICKRCGLALPHGGILSIGPYGLPPCFTQPPVQDV